mmetsp:Transcript_18241/g.25279  ORF Transcript_18241/g.25279 Transcript_18241/m.25279 type:complete len:109 (-) Transcript_18241:35-361(-)
MASILRTADISHVLRSFSIHSWWTDKFTLETTSVNVAIGRISSKSTATIFNYSFEKQLKSSIFFIEKVAQPTFESFCKCFPDAQPILISCSRNLIRWKFLAFNFQEQY